MRRAAVLAALTALGAGWLLRAEGLIWAGVDLDQPWARDVARRYVGDASLPVIYRRLEALGEQSAAERGVLARMLADVRYEHACAAVGTRLISEVQAATLPEEPAMTAAVLGAWRGAPRSDEEADVLAAIAETDWGLRGPVLCAALPEATYESRLLLRGWLLSMVLREQEAPDPARGPSLQCAYAEIERQVQALPLSGPVDADTVALRQLHAAITGGREGPLPAGEAQASTP